MKTIKQRMQKDHEEGFTLIELMVVVLILGILMAIAIPTFLSLTSSAKTNAAQSDLTTATQDEATLYTQNGTYGADAPGNVTGVKAIDTGLNWSSTAPVAAAGTKGVLVVAVGTAGNEVILGTASSSGTNYWVDDKAGTLTYAVTTSAVTGASPGPVAADFTGHSSWASLSGVTAATS